jgi:outer membrane biosynthesis protein TonB
MYLGTRHKVVSIFRTAIVFTIIIFLLLWLHFRTPIPPYPEGGGGPGMGLEVNLGSSDQGMGDNQLSSPINMPDFKPTASTSSEADKVLTQDEEETEHIESSEKKEVVQKEKKAKRVKKAHEKSIVKEADKTVESDEQPKLNQKAMFKSKKVGGNEGITGKPGDQGNPNGIVGSPIYTGNGNGSGGGTGGGSGTGTGTDKGAGISFSLDGRIPLDLKLPEDISSYDGKVVVEIKVDKNGSVIFANPGVRGSTTLDDHLLQVAREAALLSKFNRNPKALVQKGIITYIFKVR